MKLRVEHLILPLWPHPSRSTNRAQRPLPKASPAPARSGHPAREDDADAVPWQHCGLKQALGAGVGVPCHESLALP